MAPDTDAGDRPRVRVLLDVDGVLNAVCRQPADHWPDWRKSECMGFSIRWSAAMGKRLLALAELPGVEFRWLTTWEHNANEHIRPLFGWPSWPVIERHDIVSVKMSGLIVADGPWWKFVEAKALYEQDEVPFVWIDDDLGHGDDGASDWIVSLDGRALGISPSGDKGITPHLLDEIESFVSKWIEVAA